MQKSKRFIHFRNLDKNITLLYMLSKSHKKYKTKHTKKDKKNKTKRMRGGRLTLNQSTDLVNHHLCEINTKVQRYRETPGYELYTAIDPAFELNSDTIGYFMQQFKKSVHKWFKFVIFQNEDREHIYIIAGKAINKHTVCMLTGTLEQSRDANDYPLIQHAYEHLMRIKGENGIDPENVEGHDSVKSLNTAINKEIPCLPVISAGSGTWNDVDKTICINNKSGHYKPTEDSLIRARDLFFKITGQQTHIRPKMTEEQLHEIYGPENAKHMSGMCL